MAELEWQVRNDLLAALGRKFRTLRTLRTFLGTKLDPPRRLDDVTEAGPMPDVLFELVDEAETSGWVDGLVDAAARHFPRDEELTRLALLVCGPPLPDFTAADLATYDMLDVEAGFRAVWSAATHCSTRAVGVAVRGGEDMFLTLVCRRLQHLLRPERVVYRGEAAITAVHYTSVADVVERARMFDDLLKERPVILPIRVPASEGNDTLTELWTGIAGASAAWVKPLLVVLAVGSTDDLPDGVTALPGPTIDIDHVRDWARRVAAAMGWSHLSPRPDRLVQKIWDQVLLASEENRPYQLYNALDIELMSLREDRARAEAALDAA